MAWLVIVSKLYIKTSNIDSKNCENNLNKFVYV